MSLRLAANNRDIGVYIGSGAMSPDLYVGRIDRAVPASELRGDLGAPPDGEHAVRKRSAGC